MNELLTAAKEILHLHMCEQLGCNSVKPSQEELCNAFDKLSKAIDKAEKPVSSSRKLTDEMIDLETKVRFTSNTQYYDKTKSALFRKGAKFARNFYENPEKE